MQNGEKSTEQKCTILQTNIAYIEKMFHTDTYYLVISEYLKISTKPIKKHFLPTICEKYCEQTKQTIFQNSCGSR